MASSEPFTVTVLFFAAARDAAGCSSTEFHAETPVSAQAVIEALASGNAGLKAFVSSPYLLAVDEEYVEGDFLISAACELALLPPVSGG